MDEQIDKKNAYLEKIHSYYELLNVWLEMRIKGKTVAPYLKQKGYNEIAVYGMKELGHRLLDELDDSGISIKYVIDKDPVLGDFVLLKPDDNLPEVDAIIVTADYYFSEIKEELETKVSCPILSLRGVLGNAFARNF